MAMGKRRRRPRQTSTWVATQDLQGVPLSQVRDLLGHASIVATERYDNQKPEALMAAAKLLETGETFKNPSSSDVDAKSEPSADAADVAPNSLTDLGKVVEVDDGVRARWRTRSLRRAPEDRQEA